MMSCPHYQSPLVVFADASLVLPPAYCGSVERYAALAMFGNSATDTTLRFNKRHKEIHRCTIAGANGPQCLTVPIEKPERWHSATVNDIRVSTHGKWWHIHWEAICSAYGRTPFFEYYADDLHPAFAGDIESLVELDDRIDRFCRTSLSLPAPGQIALSSLFPTVECVEYYQLWASRFGFMPNLSVLDLIFNMGPEAPLVLKAMQPKPIIA